MGSRQHHTSKIYLLDLLANTSDCSTNSTSLLACLQAIKCSTSAALDLCMMSQLLRNCYSDGMLPLGLRCLPLVRVCGPAGVNMSSG